MKPQLSKISLVIFAALVLSVPLHAQQTATDEQALRLNIQRLIENGPGPTEVDEGQRKALLALRGKLVRLLLKRSGGLESRIANLEAPGAMPEVMAVAATLRVELKAVNDEIATLDQALGGVLPPAAPAATPVGAKPALNTERVNFDREVATFSPSNLKAAALPTEAVKSSPPTCDDKGFVVGDTSSMYARAVCRLAKLVAIDKGDIDLERQERDLLTILSAKLLKTQKGEAESYAAFVTEAQENRIDQQMGAGPTSNSATSIVSKGGIPYLLGFAVENGAATRTDKDTSITFRVNPGGFINLFANRGFITGFRESERDPVLKFLRKTSVGLTFDTDRGDTPGVFTGRGQQLSEVSARFELINERDPRSRKYAAEWERFVATEGLRLAQQIVDTSAVTTNWGSGINDDITFTEPALQAWLNNMNQAAKAVPASSGLTGAALINATAKVINDQADGVPVTAVSEKTIESLTSFAGEVKTYTERKNELLDRIAKGRILTFEYTNKREVNAPDTSNFNFIASTGMEGRVDLTANGSFTFFHSRPPLASPTAKQAGRIRDFQFAGQIEVPLRQGFDLWFSGRYERLMEDASPASGIVVPGTKGDIAIGQIGLNVPLRGLGMKFPISVTFANRTELIKEKVVRGNFGFTFNWDTLLSKLKPF